ncbi:MAG: TonB-dependent receptor [Cyclobacteriaceae bacterium]|nr:TonB-dependent receptor [Cyclobacteriaceae bacterium]
MKKIILSVLLLIVSFSVFGQYGSLKGSIKTSDNQPAPYVNVLVKSENKGAVTDAEGLFSIRNLKPGDYTLIVSLVGSETIEKFISIGAGLTTELNLMLNESSRQLAEVVVLGELSLNETKLAISKLPVSPMDLPQSVVTINQEVLTQQQTLRLSDVLMNVNGVYMMGNTGGTQEELAGRGFNYGSSNTFKNGSRFNNGVMPEVSSLERVEVLKGSNAILFGNVSAGGVINLVTKKPKFENGGEISFRTGSYAFFKPSVDIYGAINNSEKIAYRVNTSYENAGSFRDQVKAERFYINPSLLFKAGKRTEILLEGDYLNDSRTSDFGIGAVNYTIPNVPRNQFIGAAWSNFAAIQQSTNLTVTHELNSEWQFRATGGYQRFRNNLYGTARPNSSGRMVSEDGTWVRTLQRNRGDETYTLGQFDVTGRFETGPVKHAVLFGADVDSYGTEATAFTILTNLNNLNNAVYDTINIYDLSKHVQRNDIPGVTPRTLTVSNIGRVGVYAQDLISLTEKVKLLAGIRYSYMKTKTEIRTLATNTVQVTKPRYDDAFTPRLGLVYQPFKTTSIFGSYANSFNLNSGLDNTGAALAPSFMDQYEVGVKNELFKGLFSVNLTAYRIVNSNLAQTILPTSPDYNPDFPTAQELAGEVTSKGLEVDMMSKPFHGVSVIAGYSYNDTRYTESTIYEKNSRLRYNPNHTANVSMYYAFNQESFLRGFNVGVTTFYTGSRVAGRSTRLTVPNDSYKLMPLPDFFLVDATCGYTLKNVSIRIKVSNLLNELSYYVHDDNSVNPIAPRMFSATVAYSL